MCPEQHDLEVLIDLGGLQPSFVRYHEWRAPDCATPEVYCKGSLQLDLGYLASERCTPAADLSAAVATLRARPRPCETDSDCTLLVLAASCGGTCPVSVPTDQVDEFREWFAQTATAICQDSDCSSVQPQCPAQRAGCKQNRCGADPFR